MGVSEKLDGLEVYSILIVWRSAYWGCEALSLVEQTKRNIDIAEAEKMAAKIKKGDKFDLNDFLEQIQQVKKMGDMGSMLEKLPHKAGYGGSVTRR